MGKEAKPRFRFLGSRFHGAFERCVGFLYFARLAEQLSEPQEIGRILGVGSYAALGQRDSTIKLARSHLHLRRDVIESGKAFRAEQI